MEDLSNFRAVLSTSTNFLTYMLLEHESSIIFHVIDIRSPFHQDLFEFTLIFYQEPNISENFPKLTKHRWTAPQGKDLIFPIRSSCFVRGVYPKWSSHFIHQIRN